MAKAKMVLLERHDTPTKYRAIVASPPWRHFALHFRETSALVCGSGE
jgi:hypothetical protein